MPKRMKIRFTMELSDPLRDRLVDYIEAANDYLAAEEVYESKLWPTNEEEFQQRLIRDDADNKADDAARDFAKVFCAYFFSTDVVLTHEVG